MLIVGIWLGFAGDITAGTVLAFAFLVSLFVGPVQMGTEILTDAQNAIVSWRRVIGILETPADLVDPGPDGVVLPHHAVDVSFRGVQFSYPSGPPVKAHKRSVKALQEALLRSLQWNQALLDGEIQSIDALMARDNLNPRQTHRLRKLAFLAPDIMEAVIAGDVPESLSLERLKQGVPLDWSAQRTHFGFNPTRH